MISGSAFSYPVFGVSMAAAAAASSVVAPPAGYALLFDPAPANLRNGSGVALNADTDYGTAVAEIYDGATLIASQGTASLRGKWLGPDSAGVGHLHLPGMVGNNASIPASADDDFGTGDFTITAHVKGLLITAGVRTICSNRSGGTGFDFHLNGATPRIVMNGATFHTSTAALGSAPDWIRCRRVGSVIKFETSADGSAWTQLGADVAVTASPNASAGSLVIGQYTSASQALTGRMRRLEINKAGTNVIVVDFTAQRHGATSFTATSGHTVTVNRSGSDCASVIRSDVICFDGVDDFYTLSSALATTNDMTFISSFLRTGTQIIDLGTSVAGSQPYGFFLTAAVLYCPCSSIYVSQLTEADTGTLRCASLIQTATSTLALDGVNKPAVTHGSRVAANAFNYIGRRGVDYGGGQLGRFAVYTSALTSGQVISAEQWVFQKNPGVLP